MSPSSHAWVNYDEDKLKLRYIASRAARRGTDLHNFANEAIRLGVAIAEDHIALSTYVRDALDYNMSSEQALYYSDNCFGTADTIGFHDGLLRIHDLKTGMGPTKMRQLEVYAALFCLEYCVDPFEIECELRIYQHDDMEVHHPDPEVIHHIMDVIIEQDTRIENLRMADL